MRWFRKKEITEEEKAYRDWVKDRVSGASEQDYRVLARATISGFKLYGPSHWNGGTCPACGTGGLIVRKLLESVIIPPVADPTLKIESRFKINDGFFCIRCGTELECRYSGCSIGRPFICDAFHDIGIRQKDGRNFFALLKDAIEFAPERAHEQLVERRTQLIAELKKIDDRLLSLEVEKEMLVLDEELRRERKLMVTAGG